MVFCFLNFYTLSACCANSILLFYCAYFMCLNFQLLYVHCVSTNESISCIFVFLKYESHLQLPRIASGQSNLK